VSAGTYRERVRFERRVEGADDGYGNTLLNWTPLITVAARIDPMTGEERLIAGKLQAVQAYEITVRWSFAARGIKPSDRAVNVRTDEVYNIHSVANDDERRREICLLCSWGDAHG
jgi:SPP1 family predicted phage head-tail adaptor